MNRADTVLCAEHDLAVRDLKNIWDHRSVREGSKLHEVIGDLAGHSRVFVS